MFKLKPYRLREGQSVKPHSHRGYLTLGFVVTGSILEYRLSASRASPIVATQHRAPALLLGKPNRIHTLIAETDSLVMGLNYPRRRTS